MGSNPATPTISFYLSCLARRGGAAYGHGRAPRQPGMSPQEYPQLAVQPIVAEFEQDQASVRRAFLACVAAYHMIEYMDRKDLQRHRQRFRKESAAFAWIDRVAHAFKHVGCDGLQRLEASSVYARPPAMAGAFICGLSMLGDTTGAVLIDGETDDRLVLLVREAVEFPGKKL